ncbi:MAG TPA: response regulator, partial [Thermoanaerobaculia bacterium]
QKEGARAEARTLASRLAALQKQLEDEREKFRQAFERWQQRTTLADQPLPATAPDANSRPPLVLVVHSDPGIRAMSKHSLQNAGYTVITASDGLEGLRSAAQHKPDAVIAQAVMPKMNARELVQLLKSRRETADVKIVLMSPGGDIGRSSDFHADEIVRDAADFNDVRAALASVLARRGVSS